MKITIIGGGNIGTIMAAEAAYKGHEVTVYTSKPRLWKKEISIYNEKDKLLLTGIISKATDSIEIAVKNAEYIWITVPAQLFKKIAEKMLLYVQAGQKIGIIPGSGGAEFAFYKIIKKGCILFGLQRVHSIARLKEYGKSVYQLGRKKFILVGAIPTTKVFDICSTMEDIFDMPCCMLDNYLSVTLTPSNQILHTSRLYSLFKNYKHGDTYLKNFLFYEEWTNDSSQILIACDKELQEICKTIPLELSSVISLQDYYESWTVETMTKKIKSIEAFKGLPSPMKKTGTGWIPNFYSRYFTADFSFGLKIIKDIAKMFYVEVPYINIIWNWYKNITLEYDIEYFNICLTKNEFIKIYKFI